MTRGRPKDPVERSAVTFNISTKVMANYEMLIYDPVSGRSKWGVKSKVVEMLLEKFFSAHINGQQTIDIRQCSHLLRK